VAKILAVRGGGEGASLGNQQLLRSLVLQTALRGGQGEAALPAEQILR
jgi:hypothetical protein